MLKKIACVIITFLSLIILTVHSYAQKNVSLPNEDNIQNIIKICAMGSSNIAEAEIEAALNLWKKKVKAQGKFKQSEIGAILDKVKNEKNFEHITDKYYECVDKRLNLFISKEAEKETTTEINLTKNNTVIFDKPECSKYACYAHATSKKVDTEICIKHDKTRLIINGENVSGVYVNDTIKKRLECNKTSIMVRSSNLDVYASGKYYSKVCGNETTLELVKDIPIKIGVPVEAYVLEKNSTISLLNIATCDDKNIRIKNFVPNPNAKKPSDDIYFVK